MGMPKPVARGDLRAGPGKRQSQRDDEPRGAALQQPRSAVHAGLAAVRFPLSWQRSRSEIGGPFYQEPVMAIAVQAKPLDLTSEMRTFIGRHTEKSFDWDAFPGSRGFPELERAQMRYIGAGGSPKANDPNTLKPGQFTLSLVHQPVGKYAACHSHEVVEHFLVLEGVLTVGWAWGDEVIEARLGPKDMVLNQISRPHGFRNDGKRVRRRPDPFAAVTLELRGWVGAVAYIARAIGAIAGAVPRGLPGRAAADIAASLEGLATRSSAANGIRNHDGRSWHCAWGQRGQAAPPWCERLV